jgi:hypothetical protein
MRRLAAVPALVLIVVAIWEIAATRGDAHEVPGDDAWAEAAAIVRQGYRPGDLIVFAPAWADPIGRLHLGDLIPVEMAARMDAARYGRIWELAIRGAGSPDVAGLAPVEQHAGEVEVRRYERTPVTVLADLAEHDARVDVTEVAFEPHRCVVVAVPAGKPTRLVFAQLPLGSELVGYFGIADVFTRRENRESVALTVEAGNARVTATAPIDEWVPFRIATQPGRADVTITLQWTADGPNEGAKQLCIAAEARQ